MSEDPRERGSQHRGPNRKQEQERRDPQEKQERTPEDIDRKGDPNRNPGENES